MKKFNVVPQREYAAVWHVRPEVMNGVLLSVDAEKEIRIERAWSRGRGERLPAELLALKNFKNIPLVISLQAPLAFTAEIPFRHAFPANAAETETVLQALLKELLDRANLELRARASVELGVDELDTILFDARIMQLFADGRESSGLGDLAGRKIEGTVHVMFTTRPVFHDLHDLLHSGQELFITEESKTALSFLARQSGLPLRVLRAEEGKNVYAAFDPRSHAFRKAAFAVEGSPSAMLAEKWHLSDEASLAVYAKYLANDVSPAVHRLLENISSTAAENFLKALRRLKISGKVYAWSDNSLPFILPFREGPLELQAFPFEPVLEHLGFRVIPPGGEKGAARFILPFLEYYYHRGDPERHRALNRHIHWIAS